MNLDNITKADIAECRKALAMCQEAEQAIARGESCGIDCQEVKDRIAQAKEFLTRVNQIYGPQYPVKGT